MDRLEVLTSLSSCCTCSVLTCRYRQPDEGRKGCLILSCCFGLDLSKDNNTTSDQTLAHKMSVVLVHSSVPLYIFRYIINLPPLIKLNHRRQLLKNTNCKLISDKFCKYFCIRESPLKLGLLFPSFTTVLFLVHNRILQLFLLLKLLEVEHAALDIHH